MFMMGCETKSERPGRRVQVLVRRAGCWMESEICDLEVGDVARMVDDPLIEEVRTPESWERGEPFLVALDPRHTDDGSWHVSVLPIRPANPSEVITLFGLVNGVTEVGQEEGAE